MTLTTALFGPILNIGYWIALMLLSTAHIKLPEAISALQYVALKTRCQFIVFIIDTMNSPDIPLDIQLFLHSLCMWLQAAQAVTGIVHSPRCLVPVLRVGWETQLTTDGQSHSLSI